MDFPTRGTTAPGALPRTPSPLCKWRLVWCHKLTTPPARPALVRAAARPGAPCLRLPPLPAACLFCRLPAPRGGRRVARSVVRCRACQPYTGAHGPAGRSARPDKKLGSPRLVNQLLRPRRATGRRGSHRTMSASALLALISFPVRLCVRTVCGVWRAQALAWLCDPFLPPSCAAEACACTGTGHAVPPLGDAFAATGDRCDR